MKRGAHSYSPSLSPTHHAALVRNHCTAWADLGRLKAKLAKLKSEVMAGATKSGGKAGDGFDVTKSGDTRVGLIGFPSVVRAGLQRLH